MSNSCLSDLITEKLLSYPNGMGYFIVLGMVVFLAIILFFILNYARKSR
jgi:hypothetical protein